MQDELRALENQLRPLEKQLRILEKKREALNDQREALNDDRRALEKQLRPLEKQLRILKKKREALKDDRRALEEHRRALKKQLAARTDFVLSFLKKFDGFLIDLKDLLSLFKPLKGEKVPVDYPPMVEALLSSPVISERSEQSSSKNSGSDKKKKNLSLDTKEWQLSSFKTHRYDGTPSELVVNEWVIEEEVMRDHTREKLCDGENDKAGRLVHKCQRAVETLRRMFAWLGTRTNIHEAHPARLHLAAAVHNR